MRSTWRFEVASPGCLNRKADMLVRLRKSGIVCCFSAKTNTRLNPISKSSIWEIRQFGLGTDDGQRQCTGCGGRTAVKRCNDAFKPDRNLEEAEVFPPPLLLLSCQILLSFSARAWHRYGNGPGLTFPRTVHSKKTLHLRFNCLLFGCTNVLSPYPGVLRRLTNLSPHLSLPLKLFATHTGKTSFRSENVAFVYSI